MAIATFWYLWGQGMEMPEESSNRSRKQFFDHRVVRTIWSRTRRMAWAMLSACAACTALPSATHATSAQDQLRRFVENVTAARGDFVQTQMTDTGKVNTQSGVFAFARPGKFRWEVRTPYAQLVISDGTQVLQYDPDLAQVTQRSLDASMGASPAAILFGTAKFEDAFIVSALPNDAGLAWLRAQPRAGDAGFNHVDIGFHADQPMQLRLLDAFGQITQIDLNAMAVHAALPPETFDFTIPAGVDVVRMP